MNNLEFCNKCNTVYNLNCRCNQIRIHNQSNDDQNNDDHNDDNQNNEEPYQVAIGHNALEYNTTGGGPILMLDNLGTWRRPYTWRDIIGLPKCIIYSIFGW